MRSRWVTAGLLAVVVVGAWGIANLASTRSGPTIEGYPVGDKMCDGTKSVTHPEDNDYICEALARTAIEQLKSGHAPIVSSETFADDYRFLRHYGIGHDQGVVVLNLADGTTRAFFVGCSWSVGNELPPPPTAAHCGLMEPMEGENWSLPPGAVVR